MTETAILLLNLGSPSSIEEIEPFLYNLFSDKELIKLPLSFLLQKPLALLISKTRAKKAAENYMKIGGSSPLLEITKAQAELLEKKLEESGAGFKVYFAMRYSKPDIEKAVKQMSNIGIKNVIALPLYPQYSSATTGASFSELKRALERLNLELKITYVKSWYDNPTYLDAVAEKIISVLQAFPQEKRKEVELVFSAHSLPSSLIEQGDPYAEHIKLTTAGVMMRIENVFGRIPRTIAFQSQASRFVKWLKPTTPEIIQELAQEGCENMVMVPISFVSDNIETLYEMDILYKKLAEENGINFTRAETLNTSQKLIEALADVALGALKAEI